MTEREGQCWSMIGRQAGQLFGIVSYLIKAVRGFLLTYSTVRWGVGQRSSGRVQIETPPVTVLLRCLPLARESRQFERGFLELC